MSRGVNLQAKKDAERRAAIKAFKKITESESKLEFRFRAKRSDILEITPKDGEDDIDVIIRRDKNFDLVYVEMPKGKYMESYLVHSSIISSRLWELAQNAYKEKQQNLGEGHIDNDNTL